MSYICAWGVVNCRECRPNMRSDDCPEISGMVCIGERSFRVESRRVTVIQRDYIDEHGVIHTKEEAIDDRYLDRMGPRPLNRRGPPMRKWTTSDDKIAQQLSDQFTEAFKPVFAEDVLEYVAPKERKAPKPKSNISFGSSAFTIPAKSKPAPVETKKIYVDDILPTKEAELSDEAEPATLLDDIIELHQRS